MKLNMLTSSLLTTTASIAISLTLLAPAISFAADQDHDDVIRAALPNGAIQHILVINLENENYSSTFGSTSPAVYLNNTLLSQGELIPNYFGTSHVSVGNYVSQVSGQGPTLALTNDCLNLASLAKPPLLGGFNDVLPGTDAADQINNPGQVIGDGCVMPAPSKNGHGVITIGDQLDAVYNNHDEHKKNHRLNWRSYAEDMGNNLTRDYGTPDSMGGATCAHPPIGGKDYSNSAASDDQYATRHNPFVYFHSVIDDQARCDSHIVPLGKVAIGTNGAADSFSGHFYEDLSRIETTPKYMFVSPNLCNDGHDATCVGLNVEGTHAGGLVAADLWLKHWMPMIFNSPAYQSGKMLVVITFDEANPTGAHADSRACPAANQADCNAPSGPNVVNFGFSQILGIFGAQDKTKAAIPNTYPGGGQVGAVLFNKHYIQAGSINTTGVYNHFSALRSYEDLLGLHEGGDDGLGHLGYASTTTLLPFGSDVFNNQADRNHDQ